MSNSSSPVSSETCLDLPEEEKENGGDRHVLSLANLRVLEPNDQIRELQTILRDRCVTPLCCLYEWGQGGLPNRFQYPQLSLQAKFSHRPMK